MLKQRKRESEGERRGGWEVIWPAGGRVEDGGNVLLERKKKRIGSLERKGPSVTAVNDANWNCLSGQPGVVRPALQRRCSTL